MITRQSRQAMGMFILCVGIIALLAGLMPKLLTGAVGLILLVGAIVSAVLTVVLDMRFGGSPKKSLFGVLVVGVITFGLVYGPIWYLMSKALSGESLLNLDSLRDLGQ